MNRESITEQLQRIAKQYGLMVGNDILEKVMDISSFRIIKKGVTLRHTGDPTDTAGLVTEGMTRCYYIDGDGNDITRGFSLPGTLCMDEGMLGYTSAIVEWETIADSTVMMFGVSDMKKLIHENDELKDIYIHTLETAMKYKIYRENGFLTENAAERYIHLRGMFPEICANVKQQHLATYLGIKPESLSRIRSAMKEESRV